MSYFRGPARKVCPVLIFAVILLFLSLFLPTHSNSAQVTLAWDAPAGGSAAGYKIYYGTASRSYTVSVDVGNLLTCTVPSLQDTLTYYFAATAYDTNGLESPFSAEVVFAPPPPPPCAYSILPTSQTFSSSAGTGQVNVTTTSSCAWMAVSNVPWIIITSNSSNAGSGPVNYSVLENTGTTSRTGNLTIAGNTFVVTQSGSSSGGVVFAVNCGGGKYIDKTGVIYRSDRYYHGGSTASTTAGINGTQDAPLYQSERWGNFSYSIPLANGNYFVKLKFAEIYWSSAGQRVFDVFIEGQKVISNLDIFALVGKNTAYDVSIPVTITDGNLDISFQATADYGKVSAIVVTSR